MKFIKYYIFILLSWAYLMISCANNNDTPDPTPPPVVDTIDINENDYIFGEWEVYYLTKAVNSYAPQREFFMDGFTIKFDKDSYTYEERNSLGELNSEGKFEVVDKSKVYLHHKGSKGQDTTSIFKITTLNEKMMVRKNSYKVVNKNNKSFYVEDAQYLRNKNRAPNETFEGYGLNKGQKMTPAYFEGKWELVNLSIWTSTDGSTWNGPDKYKDEEKYLHNYFTFTFSSDVPKPEIGSKNKGGYFTESSSKGDKIINRGEFVIIDDVLHNYYYENNEGVKIGRMAPLHINIEKISGNENNEFFEDIARAINYDTNTKDGFEIRNLQSLFYKPKTGW